MTATFDPERLLASLPTLALRPPGPRAPKSFLTWRWPRMQLYNGFTHEERVENWQIGRWLIAAGCIIVPRHCSICGRTEKVGLHSEDYYAVLRSPTACAGCHSVLHRRFSRPDAWAALVARHRRSGDEWFALVSLEGFDLAEYIRTTRGESIVDMRSAVQTIPAIASAMPVILRCDFYPGGQFRLDLSFPK